MAHPWFETDRDLQPFAKVLVYGGFVLIAALALTALVSDGMGVQVLSPWHTLVLSQFFPLLYLLFAASFTLAGYSVLYGRHPHPAGVAVAWSVAAVALSFLGGLVGLLLSTFLFTTWWYGRKGGFERGYTAIRSDPWGVPLLGVIVVASAGLSGVVAVLVQGITPASLAALACAPLIPAVSVGLWGAWSRCGECGARHEEGGPCPWGADAWPPKPGRR